MALSALSRHTMLERQFQLRERRVVIPQSKKKKIKCCKDVISLEAAGGKQIF